MKTRKKRVDRNHVIYKITTSTNDNYIGLTVVSSGRAFLNSVKQRVQRHFSAAKMNNKDWTFSAFIRNNPDVQYTYEVVEVVRGRAAAHKRERELINSLKPSLNTK
jgi:hypothetical protein